MSPYFFPHNQGDESSNRCMICKSRPAPPPPMLGTALNTHTGSATGSHEQFSTPTAKISGPHCTLIPWGPQPVTAYWHHSQCWQHQGCQVLLADMPLWNLPFDSLPWRANEVSSQCVYWEICHSNGSEPTWIPAKQKHYYLFFSYHILV